MVQTRVQKIISQWGIASRRQAEKMILTGRVTVNGSPAQLGQTADPNEDKLTVDNKPIHSSHKPKLNYYLIHKPLGYVCTCSDPQGRNTVMDLLPSHLTQGTGIHPVGRLDFNSTGALILTNDGNLTLQLTHPRYYHPKTYQVWVQGHPPASALNQWQQGVTITGETKKTLPAQVKIVETNASSSLLKIVLREGKNRQIRKVAKQLGFPVIKLHRSAIGKLKIDDLRPGAYRSLSHQEVTNLVPVLSTP